jgi:hypothetical protein
LISRRRRPLEPLDAQPDRAIGIAAVELDRRKPRQLMLIENELRTVREFVLQKPRRHALVQLHQRLDVVEQPGEASRSEFAFGGQVDGTI